MFKITIEGATMSELATNALALAAQFQTTAAEPQDAAPARTPRKAKPAAVEPDEVLSAEDAQLERELKAPVEPAPATANAVVDAGTGAALTPQPAVKQMTFDDVKLKAAELAKRDGGTPILGALVKKYGGTNLSSIPKENLGDFAADVLEALG